MSKRITIDLTVSAEQEVDRLCREFGMSTPDLFRMAMSVLRQHNRQLDLIAKQAAAHHEQQPMHVLLHSLTVDIPAMCESYKHPTGRES